MSGSKDLAFAFLNDSVLGAFGRAPTSEKLDHAVRYLSTWNGTDKFFSIIQYVLKLVIPFLDFRARLQYRYGKRKDAISSASGPLSKLCSLIGDSRMLYRFWGLLPIYQWLTSLERMPAPTRKLLTIERIQGWSMLLYYPFEHLYYLRTHGILPEKIDLSVPFAKNLSVKLNASKLALWSTRAWAIYVFLHLSHLREDARLLRLRERALAKSRSNGDAEVEKADLAKRKFVLRNEFIENLANVPLTIHWSLEKGLFSNDIWVGVFGLIAALASFANGWQATALRPPPVDPTPPPAPSNIDVNLDVPAGVPSTSEVKESDSESDEKMGSIVVV
ncbi:hypothetical protein ACEPAF_3922 [Sanghuangporus sanghuang]